MSVPVCGKLFYLDDAGSLFPCDRPRGHPGICLNSTLFRQTRRIPDPKKKVDPDAPPPCTCDIVLIMRSGCQCGGS